MAADSFVVLKDMILEFEAVKYLVWMLVYGEKCMFTVMVCLGVRRGLEYSIHIVMRNFAYIFANFQSSTMLLSDHVLFRLLSQ